MSFFNVFLLGTLFISLNLFAEEKKSQCSNECKIALVDAEFEFPYHSGASSTSIAGAIFAACGEAASKDCQIGNPEEDGTIVYLEWAGCVHEATKLDCQQRYDANRSWDLL